MNSEYLPWKMLSATVGAGVLTEGWNLDAAPTDELEGSRSFTVPVAFASPFLSPPVVHLGLTGFDIEEHNSARITLSPANITAEGFDVVISTWRSSRVYSVEFSWLAVGA